MCLFFSPDGFHGDVYLTIKLLLPGVIKIVYNLNDKQIVKLFSRIFNCNQEEMVRDLEQVSADSSSLNFCCSALCHLEPVQNRVWTESRIRIHLQSFRKQD